ncbi:MAG: hypothetical protein ACLGHN_14755 [Bacteriovoracia bacterium]
MKFILLLIMTSTLAIAQGEKDLYLSTEDQKYFKNDVMEGNNQFERINMNVKEINKLHGEVAELRAEIQKLKKEITELKKK